MFWFPAAPTRRCGTTTTTSAPSASPTVVIVPIIVPATEETFARGDPLVARTNTERLQRLAAAVRRLYSSPRPHHKTVHHRKDSADANESQPHRAVAIRTAERAASARALSQPSSQTASFPLPPTRRLPKTYLSTAAARHPSGPSRSASRPSAIGRWLSALRPSKSSFVLFRLCCTRAALPLPLTIQTGLAKASPQHSQPFPQPIRSAPMLLLVLGPLPADAPKTRSKRSPPPLLWVSCWTKSHRRVRGTPLVPQQPMQPPSALRQRLARGLRPNSGLPSPPHPPMPLTP